MRAPDDPCGWQPDLCSELALQALTAIPGSRLPECRRRSEAGRHHGGSGTAGAVPGHSAD